MKKRGEKKAKKEKAENEAENRRKGKNVRYTPSGVLRRVILIFAALYLAGMGISTALVQQKFRQDHQRYLGDIADMGEGLKRSRPSPSLPFPVPRNEMARHFLSASFRGMK